MSSRGRTWRPILGWPGHCDGVCRAHQVSLSQRYLGLLQRTTLVLVERAALALLGTSSDTRTSDNCVDAPELASNTRLVGHRLALPSFGARHRRLAS